MQLPVEKAYVWDALDKTLTKKGGLNPRLLYEMEPWIHNIPKHVGVLKEDLYLFYNGLCEQPKCKCGAKTKFVSFIHGYRKYCSKKCASLYTRDVAKKNTNYSERQTKYKKTMLDRYGVENGFQSNEIKQKIIDTNLSKYGVENFTQTEKYNNKLKKTCLIKYGVEHHSQNIDVKKKTKETNISRYGVDTPIRLTRGRVSNDHVNLDLLENKDWLIDQHKNKKRTLLDISKECNCTPTVVSRYMERFGVVVERGLMSQEERKIVSFLKELEINYETSVKIIPNSKKEVDIFIPKHSLAIEVNGLYWHSELNGKDRKYHINKTRALNDVGIRLIHLWDYEVNEKFDKVKSILRSILGKNDNRVYARKCKVVDLSVSDYRTFLNNNHIQGYTQASIKLGLTYNDELVCVMGVGKNRFADGELEIIRFCNKINTTVVGGLSKLLSKVDYDIISSYCDLRLFNGEGYSSIGFEEIRRSSPSYFYIKGNSYLGSRYKYQKSKLHNHINDFNSRLSEWENMKRNGYDRVWDCGNVYMRKINAR